MVFSQVFFAQRKKAEMSPPGFEPEFVGVFPAFSHDFPQENPKVRAPKVSAPHFPRFFALAKKLSEADCTLWAYCPGYTTGPQIA